jgi:hypothetical protein
LIGTLLAELPPQPSAPVQSSREIAEHVESLRWMSKQDHPVAEQARVLLQQVYAGRFLTVEDAKRVRVMEGSFTEVDGSSRALQLIELEPPLSREAVKKSLRKRARARAIA